MLSIRQTTTESLVLKMHSANLSEKYGYETRMLKSVLWIH